jgi:hypothetical protein
MIEQNSPMNDQAEDVNLVAFPPPPKPPLVIALAIILAGLIAPFLFLRAGSPSPFLAIAALALALAGVFALAGALHGRGRRLVDPNCRLRARISGTGITLYNSPPPAPGVFFPTHQISKIHLLPGALIIHTAETYPTPGRHVVRFSKLQTPRSDIIAAIKPLERP